MNFRLRTHKHAVVIFAAGALTGFAASLLAAGPTHPPPGNYRTSWLGNSFSGASNHWVQDFFTHIKLQPNGTVSTLSGVPFDALHVETLTLGDMRFSLAADELRPVINANRAGRLNLNGFRFTRVPSVTEAAVTTNNYVITALADDGSFALSYLPTQRALSIDLSKASGKRVAVSWSNPRTGEVTSFGEFTDKTRHAFEPPAGGDWVLVLDDTAQKFPAPGTSSFNE